MYGNDSRLSHACSYLRSWIERPGYSCTVYVDSHTKKAIHLERPMALCLSFTSEIVQTFVDPLGARSGRRPMCQVTIPSTCHSVLPDYLFSITNSGKIAATTVSNTIATRWALHSVDDKQSSIEAAPPGNNVPPIIPAHQLIGIPTHNR
jgi:hypothetical protein